MKQSTLRLAMAAFLSAFTLSACGSDPPRNADVTPELNIPVVDSPVIATEVLEDSAPPAAAVDSEPTGQCDPNYTPCVPIDSDVDCAGGKGNGPSYVVGPVRVVGGDPYGLDGDGDGVGCEN
jgi:hypothetical protein